MPLSNYTSRQSDWEKFEAMTGLMFSGSYDPNDVTFLLKVINMPETCLDERERRIQSGLAHYSEMIGSESVPSKQYQTVFYEATKCNAALMARLLVELASIIAAGHSGHLTLVSIARAGTPIGVLLGRILRTYFQRSINHYSISLIRDRGIDQNALRYILQKDQCLDSSFIFVDGWTGKGVIARELIRSIVKFNEENGTKLSPALHVLIDICGAAEVAPETEDFLVPSSILNSIVSGLISRTILNDIYINKSDFHGCLFYEQLASSDLSRWFVDLIMEEVDRLDRFKQIIRTQPKLSIAIRRNYLKQTNLAFIKELKDRHAVQDENHIKLGLGEATRVLLRRKPDTLILRNKTDNDIQHLLILAEEKKIPVILDNEMPYKAAAIIRSVNHD